VLDAERIDAVMNLVGELIIESLCAPQHRLQMNQLAYPKFSSPKSMRAAVPQRVLSTTVTAGRHGAIAASVFAPDAVTGEAGPVAAWRLQ